MLGAAVMIGDASVVEVLRQAHAGAARAVVQTTNNDMTNLEVSLLVRELNPQMRVVLLLNDPQFANMLRDAASIDTAISSRSPPSPSAATYHVLNRMTNLRSLRKSSIQD